MIHKIFKIIQGKKRGFKNLVGDPGLCCVGVACRVFDRGQIVSFDTSLLKASRSIQVEFFNSDERVFHNTVVDG